jgi:hypothetical protein
MYNPSGAKPAANVVIKEGSTYSFPDAYSGDYEFFDNRPIAPARPSDEANEKPSSQLPQKSQS